MGDYETKGDGGLVGVIAYKFFSVEMSGSGRKYKKWHVLCSNL